MKKSDTPALKKIPHVYLYKNNIWAFDIMVKGKRYRKTFKTQKDAEEYMQNWFKARALDLTYFTKLTGDQIKDIKDAIAELPPKKTLLESVRKAWTFYSEFNLHALADDFTDLKTKKLEVGMLKKDEYDHIVGRVNNFKKNFKTFTDVSKESVLEYLKNKGSNKTVSNWRGTISEIFDHCVSKGAIAQNPLKTIRRDELLVCEKENNEKEIGFITVESAREFFKYLENRYPKYCRFYALALFCGIRIAEIPRLKDEYFRYDERKIIFPAKIGKVKKSWTLEDLPANLWAWLDKYKDTKILQPYKELRTNMGKQFNLPHNFARHSFATYHLSLYFDTAKTAKITRNSEQMLKDKYWGALLPKDLAKAYFEIMPA